MTEQTRQAVDEYLRASGKQSRQLVFSGRLGVVLSGCHAAVSVYRGREMMFTIEFFRIRKEDNAHAMLDRVTYIASDLESAKVKARSLFDTLNMPQNPDGLRILDQSGNEVFFWTPGIADS
jgi:hypothetical protein